MNLFHRKVIDRHIINDANIPEEHLSIIASWKNGLSKGQYDRETSHDAEFIQKILKGILGYKGSGDEEQYNLEKNQPVGTGNVDVALGKFSPDTQQIIVPFELKGAKTHNLDAIMAGRNKSPVQQAWEYAMDAKGAKWVLVSNYKIIRLYAIGYGRKNYEEFDIRELDQPKKYFSFMLLLNPINLLGKHTLALLTESENRDKEITNSLYSKFKELRIFMMKSLSESNPKLSSDRIIRTTQTILDRVLFVAFAEDRGLLPKETLKSCYTDRGKWDPQPAWDNFKALFRSVDKGNPPLNIPGYNGGLFSLNKDIEKLSVSDQICNKFMEIGSYDFQSEVSVNILGHIFEQSISDIENIKRSLKKENFSSLENENSSKRKNDGIFYTPPFVTHQIVESTLGLWLQDKKVELGFEKLPELTDQDYSSIQVVTKGRNKGAIKSNAKIKKHIKAWESYKTVLSNVRVLDPACGSGAFLNEVFDCLLSEGLLVNDELTTLNGGQRHLFRWDKHILSNNIYGVDLNSESVELTKLSLWLKTANKNEKLTYLDDNIKCGNSLIDCDETSPKDFFDWEGIFFSGFGGKKFDVIVGNPPYGAKLSEKEQEWLKDNYDTYEYQVNTYVLFYERGLELLEDGGILGYITPATFTYQHYFQNIRELLEEYEIRSICKYAFPVFDDADIGDTVSFVAQNVERSNLNIDYLICENSSQVTRSFKQFSYDKLFNSDGTYNLTSSALNAKFLKKAKPLGDFVEITAGVKPYQKGKGKPKQTRDIVKNKPFTIFGASKSGYQMCLVGSDFHRYGIVRNPQMRLKYGVWLAEPRAKAPFFESEKIIVRQTADRIIAHLDETQSVNLNNVYNIGRPSKGIDLKYILGLLNSELMVHVYRSISQEKGKLFAEVKKVYLSKLPIIVVSKKEQRPVIYLVDTMLSANSDLHLLRTKFFALLKSEFEIKKFSKVMNRWWELDFPDFAKEIKKLGVELSVKKKSEWHDFFDEQKNKAIELEDIVQNADYEINEIVCSLYGVSYDDL